MAVKRIVVIGASSGGIEALRSLADGLARDFPAPICAVMHLPPQAPGLLDRIVDAAGPLSALVPTNGERLRAGRIYVAPPDHHLIVEPGVLRLTKGPKENRFRPAIDPSSGLPRNRTRWTPASSGLESRPPSHVPNATACSCV